MKPGVELAGKRVLVVGLARTGVATAQFCLERGARVAATEEQPEEKVAEAAAKLRGLGVELELGGHRRETFLQQDLIIPSPGVPFDMPHLVAARSHGVRIWSEIELAWRSLRGRLVAVTGSNGKTTTTALIGHILKSAGLPTLVGGNIGTPLISLVELSSDAAVTVAEVSSFQLEAVEAFHPEVGVLLNITPDHLDRHASYEDYVKAKGRIFENQDEHDAAVINADDPEAARLPPAHAQVYWTSRARRVAAGAYLREGQVVFRRDGADTVVMPREEIPLRGEHNVENVLAATAAAALCGVSAPAIAAAVRSFAGVEHRLEFVAEIRGVSFYNDSKATNVDATLKALDAFATHLWVILGGKDKGSDYTVLADLLQRRARLVLLIGAAAEKISKQLEGVVPMEQAGTLERAVRAAFERAQPGDVILLAPACASFDQFQNYEHRGRVFKQIVRQLELESAANGVARAS